MTLGGGLRSRMIEMSTFETIKTALTALDWFASGRRHQPIILVNEAQEPTGDPIAFNTLALSSENVASSDEELGSLLAEHRRSYYVDFFAESDALGQHVIGDVKDILEGRMPSLGRSNPIIDVYDYRQATPPQVFYVEVEGVTIDRAHGFPQPWARHWFSVQFTLIDYYSDDGTADILAPPAPGGIVDGRDILNDASLIGIQVSQGSLTIHSGDYNAVDGEHITGLWIQGTLNLPHASTGGLATNCKIDGGQGPNGCGVNNYSGGQLSTGWLVQYCTIGSKTITPGWNQLVLYGGVDFQYCEILGGGTDCASSMNAGGELMDANFIHGFSSTGNNGTHSDLLQLSSGSGQRITRNFFIQDSFNAQAEQDASIIIKSDQGVIDNVLVGHNLFMVDPSQVPWNQCLVVVDEFIFSSGASGSSLTNVTLDTNYVQAGVFGSGGVLNANITPTTTTNFWVDASGVVIGTVVNFDDGNYPNTSP